MPNTASQPSVQIIIQPAEMFRYRYLSEVDNSRSCGSIRGATPDGKTYPTIRVDGYQGPYLVILSLLTRENKLAHPHSIEGTDERYTCKYGVIFFITDKPEVVFNNIGIICVKAKTKEDVKQALLQRKKKGIDPFSAGFEHINNIAVIDFTAVRLCFQVYLPGPDWTPHDRNDLRKYSYRLAPVASDVVYDSKKHNNPVIKYISSCAGPVSGGTEMNLWCENQYTGQDPDVIFDDGRGWTQTAEDIVYHKHLALRFKAPPHPRHWNPDYAGDLKVNVYLRRPTDRGLLCSRPVPVEYLPNDPKKYPFQFPSAPPADYLAKKIAKSEMWKPYPYKSQKVDSYVMPGNSRQAQPLPPSSVQLPANINCYGASSTMSSSGRTLNSSHKTAEPLFRKCTQDDVNHSPSTSFHSNNEPEPNAFSPIDHPMSAASHESKENDPELCPTLDASPMSSDELVHIYLDSGVNAGQGNVDVANDIFFRLYDELFPSVRVDDQDDDESGASGVQRMSVEDEDDDGACVLDLALSRS